MSKYHGWEPHAFAIGRGRDGCAAQVNGVGYFCGEPRNAPVHQDYEAKIAFRKKLAQEIADAVRPDVEKLLIEAQAKAWDEGHAYGRENYFSGNANPYRQENR